MVKTKRLIKNNYFPAPTCPGFVVARGERDSRSCYYISSTPDSVS